MNTASNSLNRHQEVNTMKVERRKTRRFQVKDKCFTIINPDPVKLVPIIDISQGGLGFYFNDNKEWLNQTSKLEIMVADCSFYMEKLPFDVVSRSRAFPTKSTSLLDGRRYGLKFGKAFTVRAVESILLPSRFHRPRYAIMLLISDLTFVSIPISDRYGFLFTFYHFSNTNPYCIASIEKSNQPNPSRWANLILKN